MQWNPSIASVFSEFLHIQESYTRFSITSYEQVFLSQLSRLVSSSLFFVIKKYIPELNTYLQFLLNFRLQIIKYGLKIRMKTIENNTNIYW